MLSVIRPTSLTLRTRSEAKFRSSLMCASLLALVLVGCRQDPPPRCPDDPRRGVYDPSRLRVLGECVWYWGTVASVDLRDDGDYHLDLIPDQGYERFLNEGNVDKADGGLVVEIMPGQHFPIPSVGEHVGVFGTWVDDIHNDWNEIHPVWSVTYAEREKRIDLLPSADPLYEGGEHD